MAKQFEWFVKQTYTIRLSFQLQEAYSNLNVKPQQQWQVISGEMVRFPS